MPRTLHANDSEGAKRSSLYRPPFDFDDWARLARTDPEAFEARRRFVIETFIRSVPICHRRRLRGLQFRIDMERRRASTPMAACIRLSSMLWDAVLGHDGLRDRLHGLLELTATEPRGAGRRGSNKAIRRAKILKFPVTGGSSLRRK